MSPASHCQRGIGGWRCLTRLYTGLETKKCPDCAHPQGWRRFWRRYQWEEWHCSECQSVLVYDSRRRWAWVLLYFAVAIGFEVMLMVTDFSWSAVLVEVLMVVAGIPCFLRWWFDSYKLKTTTERLCDKCGCRLKPGFNTCR